MASWEENNYGLLQTVLDMHNDGRLKNQVLGKKDIAVPPDMRAYVLRDLVLVPPDSVAHLGTLVEKKISLLEMKIEAQNLSRLCKVYYREKWFVPLLYSSVLTLPTMRRTC